MGSDHYDAEPRPIRDITQSGRVGGSLIRDRSATSPNRGGWDRIARMKMLLIRGIARAHRMGWGHPTYSAGSSMLGMVMLIREVGGWMSGYVGR